MTLQEKLSSVEADIVSAAALGTAEMHAVVFNKLAALDLSDPDDLEAVLAGLDAEHQRSEYKFAAYGEQRTSNDGMMRAVALGSFLAPPVVHTVKYLMNKQQKEDGWERLVASSPGLVASSPERARMAFDLLHQSSPQIASNTPLAADLIKQMTSMPQLDLGTVKGLSEISKNLNSGPPKDDIATKSLGALSDVPSAMAGYHAMSHGLPVGKTGAAIGILAQFKTAAGIPTFFDWNSESAKQAGLTDAFSGPGTTMDQANNAFDMNQQEQGNTMLPLDTIVRELISKEQELMQREEVMAQQEQQLQQAMQQYQQMAQQYQEQSGVDPSTGQPAAPAQEQGMNEGSGTPEQGPSPEQGPPASAGDEAAGAAPAVDPNAAPPTESDAGAAPESAAPVDDSGGSAAEGEDAVPEEGAAPADGEVPAEGEVPPEEGAAPAEGEMPPEEGAAPAEGEMPPEEGGAQQAPPMMPTQVSPEQEQAALQTMGEQSQTMPPADENPVGGEAPAEGEEGLPVEGAAPAEGEVPVEGEEGPPAEGEEGPPAEGGEAVPAEGEEGPPAEGDDEYEEGAPTEGDVPAEGEEGPPADGAIPAEGEVPPDAGMPPDDGMMPPDAGMPPPPDAGMPPTDAGMPPPEMMPPSMAPSLPPPTISPAQPSAPGEVEHIVNLPVRITVKLSAWEEFEKGTREW